VFAYQGPQHIEAMHRKAADAWYTEELFACLQPIASYGRWEGRDPLGNYAL
jgi:hypothetical protein